ncbi:MAG: 50S ribosomal protein L21 [Bdellovibrionales bacterium]|nr:50S ribosomal protein L21 [Bdellovibrionales bacterium]
MYAIIRTGGKQYRVKAGDVIRVEKFDGDLGSEMNLTDVMFVGGDKNFIGTPVVANASVTVVVTNQARAPKVIVFKKKRRQGYRRTNGHRQQFTEIFVKAISNPDGQTSKADSEPQVYDAEKRAQRLMKSAEIRKAAKAPGQKEAKVSKKKAATKKKVTKKKVTKKKTAAKKTTSKKVTKKKTSKKK